MNAKPAKPQTESEAELPTFEPAIEQVEAIIDAIESGEITLEQSIEQYARGMKLITHCRSILDRAESRIKQLTTDSSKPTDARGGGAAGAADHA